MYIMEVLQEFYAVNARVLKVGNVYKGVFNIAQEKACENKIKAWLKAHNCYNVKFFANAYTKAGVPDILACVNGYFVGIEVKADNGHPSDLQLYNVRKIREAGGFAWVVYPSGYDELTKILNDLHCDTFNREGKEILK